MTGKHRPHPPSPGRRIAYGALEEPVELDRDDATLEHEARRLARRATAAQLAAFLDGPDALAEDGDEAWDVLVERFVANRMDAVAKLRRMRDGMAALVPPAGRPVPGAADARDDGWSRLGRGIRDFLDRFDD